MDSYSFHVEPFSEDVTGRLAWGVLGNTLLRVAEKSAITHGFGFGEVHERNTAWVLSRLLIEMPQMPRSGQAFNVSTWVARIYRQFTDRLFAITDNDGTPLGYATSVWALIDLDTRQPVSLADYDNPRFHAAMDTQTVPLTPFGRCRVETAQPVRTIPVMRSDLDINGHVNSIRYMQMAIDTIYHAYGDTLDIRRSLPCRVEMTYASETFYGDTLTAFAGRKDETEYHTMMTHGDGTPVVKSIVRFG